jgi:hypothetical protein
MDHMDRLSPRPDLISFKSLLATFEKVTSDSGRPEQDSAAKKVDQWSDKQNGEFRLCKWNMPDQVPKSWISFHGKLPMYN